MAVRFLQLWIITVVLLLPIVAAAQSVTLPKLLKEMTDLDRLTRLPELEYVTRQFSSYDRKSTDAAAQTDDNWYANYDRGQYLREETRNGSTEYVLMEAEGPGAIVRIWSANPADAGIIRVYIDNWEEPVIDRPLEELLSGSAEFFPAPIAGTRGRGWNSYLPIPYYRRCKVTTTEPDFYYHINYRTYEKRTGVNNFSDRTAERELEEIQKIADALESPRAIGDYDARAGARSEYALDLSPGETSIIIAPEGENEIATFTAMVEAADVAAALRGCLLEISFDNQETPAVQAPLGDFFSTAPGINPFEALPLGVTREGEMYCHWRMPYKSSAVVRVTNHTQQEVKVHGRLDARKRAWAQDSLYFHAKWRSENNIETQPRQDWNFLEVQGVGRFVGVMMHIANPVPGWWGEGDEKIYVDGETFPSHFGTGTEDYFGYAWCDTQLFSHAYHNQVRCDGPQNFGYTTINRFHIIDDIPFSEAFKFDMEIWHWNETEVSQSIVAYWYARPGAKDNFAAPAPESLVLATIPDAPEVKHVEGALEGEDLTRVAHSGGDVVTQTSYGWGWSGAEQLWWLDAKPGDTLELTFNAPAAGRYVLQGVFTKAPDYGIVQLHLNGQRLGEPIDLYHTSVEPTPELPLGTHALEAGQHTLRVELVGTNPKADPRHMFGLDYLLLEAAPAE